MRLLSILFISSLVLTFSSCKKDISGCMDPSSINYNEEATLDDGTCQGCMDPQALNYNPKATTSGGDCQYLAPSETKKKNVVIEAFTGGRCGWCPYGHEIMKDYSNANPGRIIPINIHTGGFANPGDGYSDFRSPFGPSLANLSDLAGYPAGMVNRTMFSGNKSQAPFYKQKDNSLAISRGGYVAAGDVILTQNAPVNLGIATKYDPASRMLTTTVEMYFTEDIDNGVQLNVAVLENKVIAQHLFYEIQGSSIVTKKIPDYEFNNMLRWMPTGQWGESISPDESKKGKRIQREIKYEISAEWEVNNMEVAAYITHSNNRDVLNGTKKALK